MLNQHSFRLFCCLLSLSMSSLSAQAVDYLSEIKPLFAQKCFACHGALKQQAGLRLDTVQSMLKGGDSGAALIPGDVEESLLLGVLTGDAGFRMPPENDGAALTAEEIQLVREWIADNAQHPANEEPQTDPKLWWSYLPITRPPRPVVQNHDWCRNEIDFLISAQREAQQLPYAVEAPREVWLRRVYLDLIGLPPTRNELQRFLADENPDAYERVVDDLLSRPQYGERWGRHWMDIWRYSDWYGSRGINEIRYSQRHIWRWRDWIVNSLNDDRGYDDMLRAMLAADEMSDADPESFAATGYLGRSWYKFDRDVWLFETVERTGEAFLGLTLRCCRCHDHKFDPVSQEEYYRFRAFFEPHDVRTDPLEAGAPTEKDATLGQVLKDGIPLVYDKNADVPTYLFQRGDSRYPDKEKVLSPGVPEALGGTVAVDQVSLPVTTWYPMLREELRTSLLEKSSQQVVAARSAVEAKRTLLTEAERKLSQTIRQELASGEKVFLHEAFQQLDPKTWETLGGEWTTAEGKLIQSAVTSFATLVTRTNHPEDMQIQLRYRPLSPGTYRSVGFSFDFQDKGNSQDVYTSTGDSQQSVQAFHRKEGQQFYPQAGIVKTDLKVGEEATLNVTVQGESLTIDLNGERKLDYRMPEKRRSGRFALWVHQGAAEFLELKITALAESRETVERQKEATEQNLQLAEAELKSALAEDESLRARLAADVAKYLESQPSALQELAKVAAAAEKRAAVLKAEVDVLRAAGNAKELTAAEEKLATAKAAVLEPGENYTPVGEQYPQTSTGRRTALAAWMTSDDNPRVARVAANHLWSRHFGRPLVATPENFGMNGRQPTHPELLDWLASELMAQNWKMKPLHKMIVLSATYRMSSASEFSGKSAQEVVVARDPENRFYWRMPSRRMEAEVVRDSLLYVAGRLDLTRGGPEIPESAGEKTRRRSLYFRSTPNEKMEMLEVFDVADPNACYRRKESVIPHQSLAMMNSGLSIDSARSIAATLHDAANHDEAGFVTAAFETVLSRKPTMLEQSRCETFLKQQAELLRQNTQQPFPAGGTATISSATDPDGRARENLIHVLFLHNDFVTVR